MIRSLAPLAAVVALVAASPVPITEEPSHHLVATTDRLRAFRVEVAPRGATLLHQHDRDYVFVALGDSTIVNAVLGKPERRLDFPDAAVRFTRGGFAHVAHNESDRPFRNVTIEFLPSQTGARNICAVVIPDEAMNCPAGGGAVATGQAGSTLLPELESDQLRIGLLTLDPGATWAAPAAKSPPFLVALDGTEAEGIVRVKIEGAAGVGTRPLRAGDVQEVPGDLPYEVHNTGRAPARFLVIAPKS
ncbi:MAG: hypothetical protein HY049_03780 [Acidobacteria bacterium]|nr:hypothetical protein [Acidobacteriota bacterium]